MKGSLIATLLCVASFLVGCTLTETTAQRHRRIRQEAAMQMRMAVEDIDAILLLDRSTNLTEWHTRIGN